MFATWPTFPRARHSNGPVETRRCLTPFKVHRSASVFAQELDPSLDRLPCEQATCIDAAVIFAATDDELRGAFVRGKRPLPSTKRTVANPFTGEPMSQQLWQVDPTDTREGPALPGISVGDRLMSLPHVDLDEDLADLIAGLLEEDEATWAHQVGTPPALVFPEDEAYEVHVWELPARVVDVLTQEGPTRETKLMHTLANLALHARESGRRLFCWL
jgi:hypothetical protein